MKLQALTDYYRQKNRVDGRKSVCKACVSTSAAMYHQKKKNDPVYREKHNARARRDYAKKYLAKLCARAKLEKAIKFRLPSAKAKTFARLNVTERYKDPVYREKLRARYRERFIDPVYRERANALARLNNDSVTLTNDPFCVHPHFTF